MNILVFSGAISPYRGSEAAVGWNFVSQISASNRLYVIYGGNSYKKDIEKYLSQNSMPNVKFVYAGDHQEKINWERHPYLGYYLAMKYYHQWHYKVLDIARQVINTYKIDVIHYLNPIGFREPGYLYKLRKPYVWGPVEGVEDYPFKLYSTMRLRGWIEGLSRWVLLNTKFRWSRQIKEAVKRCNIIISATPKTKNDFQKYYSKSTIYIPENAILKIENNIPIEYSNNDKLNIISVGQLSDRKGYIIQLLVVRRLLELGFNQFKWTIIGQGYNYKYLTNYIRKYNLSDYIVMAGSMSRDNVYDYYRQSHLNVITSLSEATTTVLWEAMSLGIPTLSLNHCGMGGVLSNEDSFLIPLGNSNFVVNHIVECIRKIFECPVLINMKSKLTIDLAKANLWSNRVEKFNKIYNLAIADYNEKNNNNNHSNI